MSIMAWIIVGIIAGWMAKRVIPGEGPKGVLGDLVVGIVGAIAGGWIFAYFGHPGPTGLNIGSIVVAFVGAVAVLWLMRLLTRTGNAGLA
ncbi:MAG TPA: GlsB/YeaQ/YmgE family stress response membrane protein [bacterium]|nr:GlsB/YeaQ/YmgE family stress response membrane protein [bacterium]